MTRAAGLTLTIVRHGDTFAPGEPLRRIGAPTDLALVASGEAQALALGALFARDGVRFERVLAAPLRRTQATARLLAAALPDPPAIEIADWLVEIDHGPDEGEPHDVVVARIGAAALARWDESLVAPPDWIVDAPMRIDAWRALMMTARGHVLIVTSNGAARFARVAGAELSCRIETAPNRRPGADLPVRMHPAPKLRTGAWGRIVVVDGVASITDWDRRP